MPRKQKKQSVLYPQVSVEEWSKTYGLTPLSLPCPQCGADRHTNIPIAFGQTRGLVSKRCKCGECDIGVFRDVGESANDWKSFFDVVSRRLKGEKK